MEVSLDGIKGHRSFRSRASTLSKLGFGGRICMTPAGSLEGKSGGARGYRVKNNRPFEAFSSDRFNFFFVSKFERCCQNRGSSKKPLCLQLVKTSWLAALLINMTDRGWILSFFLPLCFLRYTLSRVGYLNQRCSKPLGLLSVVSNVRRGSGSSADTLIDNCSIDLWSPLIYPPASWIFLLSNQSPIILPFHRDARDVLVFETATSMIKDFGEITRHPVVALFFADLSVCLWCSVSFSKVNLPVAFISGRRGRWRKAEGEVREVGQTRGTAWRGIEMREEACKIFRAPITFFFFLPSSRSVIIARDFLKVGPIFSNGLLFV